MLRDLDSRRGLVLGSLLVSLVAPPSCAETPRRETPAAQQGPAPEPARAPAARPDRVRVEGGSFVAGLDAAGRERALAHCSATSVPPAPCSPGILHNEGRTLTVQLAGFEIDRVEVSQARYAACVAAGACTPLDLGRCSYGDGTAPTGAEWAVLQRAQHPVVCVTFAQAEAHCRWAGGRVPTEVEWERAARGGDGRIFPWGDVFQPRALNWGDGGAQDGHTLSAPVGSYPAGASPYGALDMVGNVWEWARRSEGFDEKDLAGKQVIRGGGFAAVAHAQRTTKRAPYDPGRAYPNVGIRCVYGAGPAGE